MKKFFISVVALSIAGLIVYLASFSDKPKKSEQIYVSGVFKAKERIDNSRSGLPALDMSIDVESVSVESIDNNSSVQQLALSWDKINEAFFPDGDFSGIDTVSKIHKAMIGKKVIVKGIIYDLCSRKIMLKPENEPEDSCFFSGQYNHIELTNTDKISDFNKYIKK
ncbi:hypothetical protein MNBD_GAMMA21-1370 [hydrothermal vent metagenome]|uniref:Uncharacterized protein n=1 Tax=hydrothermal vent metagenome TaxID=652676 RepID=A0A3B0ZX87_9ZZZZ